MDYIDSKGTVWRQVSGYPNYRWEAADGQWTPAVHQSWPAIIPNATPAVGQVWRSPDDGADYRLIAWDAGTQEWETDRGHTNLHQCVLMAGPFVCIDDGRPRISKQFQTFEITPDDLAKRLARINGISVHKEAPKCDCGAVKARTTHSDWCSTVKP